MTANDANKWAKEHASNTLANNLVYILNQIEDYAKRDHFDTSFSNIDGSHCSSLGKYKIGNRAWSDWGINVKYVLHGLENTNSNAQARYIVFHSWEKVSDTEIYPDGTPEGWGCPTISNKNMKIVDAMLKKSNKPVLMWIYNK